jgi:protein-S-isoprenylcysteine O-methyltransferase Ste14
MPRNVRSAFKKDLVQFAIPGLIVFGVELSLLASGALHGFWGRLWGVISHPSNMADLPTLTVAGMFFFVIGLGIMCWGQVTLHRNYSGTVVIREGHKLITHGIYRYVRNPMYFGLLIGVCFGLPAYGRSLNAFLVSLLLVPIILNRIRLEEELLTEHFGDEYLDFKASTKRLIPFVY